MPRRKRKPTEWTTAEAERKLFPKKVVDEVHREVQEQDKDAGKRSSQDKDTK